MRDLKHFNHQETYVSPSLLAAVPLTPITPPKLLISA